MKNKHINTTYPYEQIIDGGYASPAFEQFLRALHLRTGNKIGVDVNDVKETAENALQTAIDAKVIADIAILAVGKIENSLKKLNINIDD